MYVCIIYIILCWFIYLWVQILHQTTTNQPTGKDKFMLASFSFSPLTYSGTSYITETIPLAHELDDQRTFNSFVRNTMISNLTRLNQLIARE